MNNLDVFLIISFTFDLGHSHGGADIMLFIVPLFLTVSGCFIMKNLVFDLIDEVYDEDSTLLFKNKGTSVRVNLTDMS